MDIHRFIVVHFAMNSLKNHLLISMPHLQDPYFSRSVVFLCEHNKDGAMGVIINKPFEDPELKSLFTGFFEEKQNILEIVPKVYFGGPVMVERGIVLHAGDYRSDGTVTISEEFSMTSSKTILQDISKDEGPNQYRLVLGHAGWSSGQLEREIENGDWLLQETTPKFLFETPDKNLWKAAAATFGIDIDHFVGLGGQA